MELLSDVHKMGNTVIMVTHNPSLTRYADRILYMLDGSIVYDEASTVGEIPVRKCKKQYTVTDVLLMTTIKLASVSAVMETIPDALLAPQVQRGQDAKTSRR
jgi:ABC-type cobalamin/Fe3+-siderophores transport system ATPase subunit